RAAREAFRAALNDERAQAVRIAALFLVEIGPCEHEEVVGDVCERDPHLLASDHIAVARLDCGRLDAANVAPGRRLGQPVRRDRFAWRWRYEIPLLLILRPPGQEREAVEPSVHRKYYAE